MSEARLHRDLQMQTFMPSRNMSFMMRIIHLPAQRTCMKLPLCPVLRGNIHHDPGGMCEESECQDEACDVSTAPSGSLSFSRVTFSCAKDEVFCAHPGSRSSERQSHWTKEPASSPTLPAMPRNLLRHRLME